MKWIKRIIDSLQPLKSLEEGMSHKRLEEIKKATESDFNFPTRYDCHMYLSELITEIERVRREDRSATYYAEQLRKSEVTRLLLEKELLKVHKQREDLNMTVKSLQQ